MNASLQTLLTAVAAVAAAASIGVALAEQGHETKAQVVQLERVVVVGQRAQVAQLPRVVVEGRRSLDGTAVAQVAQPII